MKALKMKENELNEEDKTGCRVEAVRGVSLQIHEEVLLFSTIGAVPPPSGGMINNGLKINILAWTEAAVALLFVGGRIYTRTRLIHNMGWDDWTIILAMSLSLSNAAVNSIQVHYGAGQDFIYLSPHEKIMALKTEYISLPACTFCGCFAKISVALLLKRIMNRDKRREFWLWFIIISVFIVNALLTAVTFLQCIPVEKNWNPSVRGACWNQSVHRAVAYFQGAYWIFMDIVLALFPILILYKIQMKRTTKLWLGFLMSLGIIAGGAAIGRIVMIKELAGSFNPTAKFAGLIYWATTENNLIIITACIPTLKPLFVKTAQALRRRQDSSPKSHDSERGLRDIRKTTEICSEYTGHYELPSSTLAAAKTGTSAEALMKHERQVV